jgi:Na+/H+ antiporter NhaB
VVEDLEAARNNGGSSLTLYFTKESHIHTLVNLVLLSGLPIANRRIPELDYAVSHFFLHTFLLNTTVMALLVSYHVGRVYLSCIYYPLNSSNVGLNSMSVIADEAIQIKNTPLNCLSARVHTLLMFWIPAWTLDIPCMFSNEGAM